MEKEQLGHCAKHLFLYSMQKRKSFLSLVSLDFEILSPNPNVVFTNLGKTTTRLVLTEIFSCNDSEILFIAACDCRESWVKWVVEGTVGEREWHGADWQGFNLLHDCHTFTDIMWVKFARGGKEVRGFCELHRDGPQRERERETGLVFQTGTPRHQLLMQLADGAKTKGLKKKTQNQWSFSTPIQIKVLPIAAVLMRVNVFHSQQRDLKSMLQLWRGIHYRSKAWGLQNILGF